jgi:hypothetical protein
MQNLIHSGGDTKNLNYNSSRIIMDITEYNDKLL